ncbi:MULTISPECIES: hypothetical protein [Muribaculaceae]|uniref:hypothetical protein n=2 Tax=Bacteroidales TaxID=171549 RepID=UPI00261F17E9|nr:MULTISPECIES: hypothetical protein [Muribaculaceae]
MKKAVELYQQIPNELFANNLDRKLSSPPKPMLRRAYGFWSDLLGFGSPFYENNWSITINKWIDIHDRLLNAHTIAFRNCSPNERALILNDGIAKVFNPQNDPYRNYLLDISVFLRGIVLTHLDINKLEKENNLPGTRSVLAFGENLSYIESEIKLDDFYLNYSKKNPDECSEGAKKAGNPTIVYNPSQLQMNTAFSKAYILESLGSKGGLHGHHFYIDNSVIDSLKSYAEVLKYDYIWEETDKYIEFLIPRKKNDRNDVVLGLRLGLPFTPTNNKWDTTVYRLLRFYPWDEKADEFWFEL